MNQTNHEEEKCKGGGGGEFDQECDYRAQNGYEKYTLNVESRSKLSPFRKLGIP